VGSLGVGEHPASVGAAVGRSCDGDVPVAVLALLRAGSGVAGVDSRTAPVTCSCQRTVGLAGVLLLQGVLSRLVALPRQQDLDVSRYPAVTVLLWVVMGAVVAGVVEETSFRGYLQRPIERRHGPVIAILIAGSLFGFAHFSHPEVGVVLLPFYLAVAAVYGALAYFTDSTLPGMLLHAGGNMFSAFDLFTRGRSEWQLTPEAQPLIWETGPDLAFWGNAAALVVVTGLTVWAYSTLARTARKRGH
jgi:membrane protease YdiL (CAAX protease family)